MSEGQKRKKFMWSKHPEIEQKMLLILIKKKEIFQLKSIPTTAWDGICKELDETNLTANVIKSHFRHWKKQFNELGSNAKHYNELSKIFTKTSRQKLILEEEPPIINTLAPEFKFQPPATRACELQTLIKFDISQSICCMCAADIQNQTSTAKNQHFDSCLLDIIQNKTGISATKDNIIENLKNLKKCPVCSIDIVTDSKKRLEHLVSCADSNNTTTDAFFKSFGTISASNSNEIVFPVTPVIPKTHLGHMKDNCSGDKDKSNDESDQKYLKRLNAFDLLRNSKKSKLLHPEEAKNYIQLRTNTILERNKDESSKPSAFSKVIKKLSADKIEEINASSLWEMGTGIKESSLHVQHQQIVASAAEEILESEIPETGYSNVAAQNKRITPPEIHSPENNPSQIFKSSMNNSRIDDNSRNPDNDLQIPITPHKRVFSKLRDGHSLRIDTPEISGHSRSDSPIDTLPLKLTLSEELAKQSEDARYPNQVITNHLQSEESLSQENDRVSKLKKSAVYQVVDKRLRTLSTKEIYLEYQQKIHLKRQTYATRIQKLKEEFKSWVDGQEKILNDELLLENRRQVEEYILGEPETPSNLNFRGFADKQVGMLPDLTPIKSPCDNPNNDNRSESSVDIYDYQPTQPIKNFVDIYDYEPTQVADQFAWDSPVVPNSFNLNIEPDKKDLRSPDCKYELANLKSIDIWPVQKNLSTNVQHSVELYFEKQLSISNVNIVDYQCEKRELTLSKFINLELNHVPQLQFSSIDQLTCQSVPKQLQNSKCESFDFPGSVNSIGIGSTLDAIDNCETKQDSIFLVDEQNFAPLDVISNTSKNTEIENCEWDAPMDPVDLIASQDLKIPFAEYSSDIEHCVAIEKVNPSNINEEKEPSIVDISLEDIRVSQFGSMPHSITNYSINSNDEFDEMQLDISISNIDVNYSDPPILQSSNVRNDPFDVLMPSPIKLVSEDNKENYQNDTKQDFVSQVLTEYAGTFIDTCSVSSESIESVSEIQNKFMDDESLLLSDIEQEYLESLDSPIFEKPVVAGSPPLKDKNTSSPLYEDKNTSSPLPFINPNTIDIDSSTDCIIANSQIYPEKKSGILNSLNNSKNTLGLPRYCDMDLQTLEGLASAIGFTSKSKPALIKKLTETWNLLNNNNEVLPENPKVSPKNTRILKPNDFEIIDFIQNESGLYKSILRYEPLDFNSVYKMVTNRFGKHVSRVSLRNLLDNQCVNFLQ